MDPIPRFFSPRRVLLSIAIINIAIIAIDVNLGQVAIADDSASVHHSSLDASTRWVFRAIDPVTVDSPIVRLGDVVQPIDRNLAAWKRLSQAPIGLVPIGGQTMTIDRKRLTQIILSAEATPRVIDWLGPDRIQVRYDEDAATTSIASRNGTVHQAAYRDYKKEASATGLGHARSPEPIVANPMSATETNRVVHWIELAIKRFQPDVANSHAVSVDPNQPNLAILRHIAGVTNLVPEGPIQEGVCHFVVTARSAAGTVDASVQVNLKSHPQVVFARRSVGRGQRVSGNDLELRPIDANRMNADAVTDLQSLVGMEVRTSLRAGVPVSTSDVGPPLLIHRGDLIEVRVLGGGVSVSANAKAMGTGSEGELIEIETISPRKRLVARVADIGVVEIITRAPVVR